MWILKFIKGLGRFFADLLFLIIAVIVASTIFASTNMTLAIVLAIPVWLGLAWAYKGVFGPRHAPA
ncbi:MAG: hypothetical protein P8L66_11590 [Rhodospirillaceae bacterium]|nr:hypothetical protein [Rhodospirillaceae bacterium]